MSAHEHDIQGILGGIVAAVVDGEPISLLAALRHARTNNRLEFISHAIDGHLIARAIQRHGIVLTDDDEARTLGVLRQDKGLEDDEAFQRWLEASGLTEATLRADIRKVVEFGRLKGKMTESLDPLLKLEPWCSMPVAQKGMLRDALFDHWLAQERAAASIDLPLARAIVQETAEPTPSLEAQPYS